MFFVCLVGITMLFSEVSLYAAASSSGAPAVRSGSALRESLGKVSPKKGSGLARGMSAVCLDLERAGVIVNADHYDAAQQHIETQLSHFDSYMPPSARSAVQSLRQQLSQEVERRKAAVLSDSITVRHSSSSEEDSGSYISSEESERADMQKLLETMQIANNLLTQHAVRAQDGLERSEHEAQQNKKWAYIGAGLGVGGLIVSILFGIVSFGIAC